MSTKPKNVERDEEASPVVARARRYGATAARHAGIRCVLRWHGVVGCVRTRAHGSVMETVVFSGYVREAVAR